MRRRRAPQAAVVAEAPKVSATEPEPVHKKGTLQRMSVEELQDLIASMEKKDRDLDRYLNNTKAQNTEFTERITLLTKKSDKSADKRQQRSRGTVTI
mmetsp:Transcript_27299/g.36522  ORF Transcript_27299/g.36522 Transcript_27299/m.36522 type:complete len:97 (+) Transcript_27299:47-337(+)